MSTPRAQAEQLLNELLSFAETMLQEHGELFPCAGVVDSTGKSSHLVVKLDRQGMTADLLRQHLEAGLREQASRDDCLLVVLITNVTVTDPTSGQEIDVIHAAAEHRDGYAADLYLPYTLADGALVYGETAAEKRNPVFFPRQSARLPG